MASSALVRPLVVGVVSGGGTPGALIGVAPFRGVDFRAFSTAGDGLFVMLSLGFGVSGLEAALTGDVFEGDVFLRVAAVVPEELLGTSSRRVVLALLMVELAEWLNFGAGRAVKVLVIVVVVVVVVELELVVLPNCPLTAGLVGLRAEREVTFVLGTLRTVVAPEVVLRGDKVFGLAGAVEVTARRGLVEAPL